jgi:hypothetical protein
MPFVSTAGSGSAQGLGQNLKLPAVLSGVPIENFFQTGTVMTGLGTAWSITCAGMPGKVTTSNGWGLMLIKVGKVVSGTRSYESGTMLIFDSGPGAGSYIQNGAVGQGFDAQSLTSVSGGGTTGTDLTFNFGTAAITSGNATTKVVWKYFAFHAGDTSFGFTRNYYGGNNATNRAISGAGPAVTWQPNMAMVMKSDGVMSWWNSSQSRSAHTLLTGYSGSVQTVAQMDTSRTSIWGTGVGAGADTITVGYNASGTFTNESSSTYVVWMFDTAASYGAKAAQKAFNRSFYVGDGTAKTTAITPSQLWTHGLSMGMFTRTAANHPTGWTMDGFGTSAAVSAAGALTPNPFALTTGTGSVVQYVNPTSIYSYSAGTGGWNVSGIAYYYYSFLQPVSDYYVNAAKYRPFQAGFKSQQKITAGATSATISINPNRYPMNMATIWVISGNGTGAVANKIYSRHFSYYNQSGSNTQLAWTLNGATNTATDTGGWDGENLQINNLVSTTNYAVLVNYHYPNMFDHGSTVGSIIGYGQVAWNLQQYPTFFMVKSMETTGATWYLWHVHDPNAYYTLGSGTFTRTGTRPWNNPPGLTGELWTASGAFTSGQATAWMVWADSAGVQVTGKYAGAGAAQTIFTNFTVGAIIIFEATEGMFMFTQAIGMTTGNNYSMNLSGTVANAVLGDVCLQVNGGFQLASSTTLNTSGRTYYYIAFAQ